MVALLIVLFIVVPIIELAVFVQVSAAIGVVPAFILVVLFSVGGGWLMKQQGLSTWRRAQAQLQAGQLPAGELVNGLLILFAGALMLTPGFATDVLGLVLLFPPTRAVVRAVLLRRFERRIRDAFAMPGGGVFAGDGFADATFVRTRVYTGPSTMRTSRDVVDVREVTPDDGGPEPRPELGRS